MALPRHWQPVEGTGGAAAGASGGQGWGAGPHIILTLPWDGEADPAPIAGLGPREAGLGQSPFGGCIGRRLWKPKVQESQKLKLGGHLIQLFCF